MLFSLSFSLQIALQHGLAVECLLGNQKIGISNSSLEIYHSLDGVNPSELYRCYVIPRTQVKAQ